MKLEKALDDFDSNQEKRLSSLSTQLGQQQDDMIEKINLLCKTIFEKLNDAPILELAGNSMAFKNIASISHIKREELKRNGIKSPSKLFSPNYLSPVSIVELNKNPSALKHIHFVNSIVTLSNENEAEERETITNITPKHDHNITKEVKEEVKEVIDEEESDVEIDEEVEEILKDEEEEEDDEDGENFNSFLTMTELTHCEWLLKNPRPPWVKARIRAGSLNNIIISYMIRHFFKRHAYIDLESPSNIMSRRQYKQIMTYRLESTQKPSNLNKINNFIGRDDEKITFKMPHTMEIYKQTRLMGLNTDFIPPPAHKENFGHERTHYYQSLLIGDEYMQDEGYRRGIRHLMRLEKEMMGDKDEVKKITYKNECKKFSSKTKNKFSQSVETASRVTRDTVTATLVMGQDIPDVIFDEMKLESSWEISLDDSWRTI
uniref:MAK10-like protein n=1 Tax=Tanacetum cinerariifolium TaxID=118510 RepID=A0A699GIC6_TANCI|nr:hypothetical protein [Tanacetum cinerariifolium]